MIVLLLLSIVQLSVAAVPMARHQEPMVLSMGGMEDMFYEIPEYEDPQLVDYIMSAMGGSPMLSLMHMTKKQPEDKDKYISPKEKLALAKETLDEVINRLQTIRVRLDKGNGHIHYDDIEKSIDGLKKLERSFRPGIGHLLSAMRQSMSISKPIIQGGILEVRTITTGGPPKMFVSTEKPSFVADTFPIALPVQEDPVIDPMCTPEPVPTEESVASVTEEEVTVKPSDAMKASNVPVTVKEMYKKTSFVADTIPIALSVQEDPVIDPMCTPEPVPTEESVASVPEEEVTVKRSDAMKASNAPVTVEEMYKKTEYKKKVESDDVPGYPKWTWKSSSFV